MMPAMPSWPSQARPCRPQPIARGNRKCSSASSIRPWRVRETRVSAGLPRRYITREVDMLGKLTWDAIPFNEPLPLISMAVVLIVILAVLGLVTVKGWWPYLWRDWLTSVDHKRIGVMYVILGLVMLLRGYSDAIMMR